MKKLFIGIDVSKDAFDYCFLNEENQVLLRGQKPNSKKGIGAFCSEVKCYKQYSSWICMEHTGYYGYLLSYEFSQRNLIFSLLSPLDLKLSMGLVRGKNDSIDAFRIASYALSHKHKITPYKLPIDTIQKLKVLMKTRNRYSKISTQLKNGLKGMRIAAKSIELKELVKQQEKIIKRFKKEMKSLEKQITSLIKSCEQLNITYKKISKVIGVGPLTAAECIIETSNFSKYTNPRKFACHCGLAPFRYESGSSVKWKTKTSPLCNKSLKGILFKAACAAIQHDPQLKRYYHRKRDEGKHKLCALNAVANKLVLRIFAVAKREEPFVKLAA